MSQSISDDSVESIAVIGMAGRFPGAATTAQLWHNLDAGVESVSRFSDEELLDAGIDPETVADPDYVKASATIEQADHWDAPFFGYSPQEAEILDPQHRLFLEVAWETLEDAGYDPARYDGSVGVFAGCFMNKYLPTNLHTNQRFLDSPYAFFARVFNDKDFLATRASYLFNLRGPSLTIQTACSTSLVATHMACLSLMSYDCDMALVGGAALNVPLKSGYPVIDGGLFTGEGHCRPFDARAQGTIPGYGAAAIALCRLPDAIASRDNIRAIIRGTAINNDGSSKIGFTAPSVDAQAAVIKAAQSYAGVDAETIGYVEAHGTGTSVGDPIEVAGLSTAFATKKRGFCALGSVKANIGHLDAASGVAGLIKAVLALEHRKIPPLINFEHPNPDLELEKTPFYINTTSLDWPRNSAPRRAGVSSLGVGGTNAHAVLEEAPERAASSPSRTWQLLTISAKTRSAVDAATHQLADHLEAHPGLRLADVAYTLQAGRKQFELRRTLACSGPTEAIHGLRQLRRPASAVAATRRPVVFMFGGGGTQYPDMGLELYRTETRFRDDIDRCAQHLEPLLQLDLRHYLYPSLHPAGADISHRPPHVLAALVATQYALAQLWMSWGLVPQALIGHSMGEYLAACLSGVFTLEQTLALAVRRGQLFEAVPSGAMLIVQLSESDVQLHLGDQLSVAAVNAPSVCVVSGATAAINTLEATLRASDIEVRPVHIAVASHSLLMDPVAPELADFVSQMSLSAPTIPFLSGVTGTWIRPDEATDPAYWARHLRQTVRFADGVRELMSNSDRVLLEVGPGNALCTLAGLQGLQPVPVALPTLRHPQDPQSDQGFLTTTLGKLWQAGVAIDWDSYHAPDKPGRVSLPTYPFERRKFWIEAGRPSRGEPVSTGDLLTRPEPPNGTDPHLAMDAAGGSLSSEDLENENYRRPRTEREQQLAVIWQQLLGVERVSVDDDFFELGGHSLLATQMMKKLRRSFGFKLNLRTLFEAPTIAQLAPLTQGEGLEAATSAIDFDAEVMLDPAIEPAGLPAPVSTPPRTVLLTGATGFLGGFLARELLHQTSAEVICLVRAEDPASGWDRLRHNLESYGIDEPQAEARLVALPGDLSQPLLGLSETTFDQLAQEVDVIYHCGAWVNFARPYKALKATNVSGTEEILRLATRRRLKPVHHISTLAVLAGAVAARVDEVLEDDGLPAAIGHDTGYSQSKWVAEKMLALARQRGLPIAVYRPSVVLGDSVSGASNEDDYLTKMIQGCVQLGLAPRRDYPLTVATVDFVSAAVVALSLDQQSWGQSFHVIDPDPLPWDQIFAHLRSLGYDVPSIDYEQWKRALSQRIDQAQDNALAPLAALLADDPDRQMPKFDCRNLLAGLEPTAVTRPAIDLDLFATLADYFVTNGWLPKPKSPTRSADETLARLQRDPESTHSARPI